ncbi:MAG: nitrous oxide reductase accessory protein NosL [Gemmatimonadaceae bacterium]|nr:nitrous oxide reductase accessory protein NosL [Gemmatimonadaceae bacterium]
MPRLVPPCRPVLLALALFAAACRGREPEPIVLNEDQCGYCRMTIADSRFGGEAVLPTGRVLKFDAPECMLSWARATPVEQQGDLYIIDLQHPGSFVPVKTAGILEGTSMQGPMGGSIVGFASPTRAEEQRTMLGGRVVTWAQLLADTANAGMGHH